MVLIPSVGMSQLDVDVDVYVLLIEKAWKILTRVIKFDKTQ